MTVKKLILMSCVLAMLVVAAGCAGTAKGPSDEEQIQALLANFKAYGDAKDMTKLLTLFSDKFTNYEYGDKAGLEKFLQDALDMGYLENAEVTTANAKVTITNDTATVYPVEMKAAFGSASIELKLAKADAAWLITGMEVQMY